MPSPASRTHDHRAHRRADPEREIKQLKRANEILKGASAFFHENLMAAGSNLPAASENWTLVTHRREIATSSSRS